MTKKISIQGYIDRDFEPQGRPAPVTVRKWCARGEIPAEKIGGTWFVLVDSRVETTGNELVDRVLAG